MIKIVDATVKDIPTIRDIADQTWWPTYSSILSTQQIEYMLDAIYSTQALQKVIENGSQRFIVLLDGDVPKGFASYGPREGQPSVCKLYKIYVLPECHGRGYGKMLIEAVKARIRIQQIFMLDLNVNRFNPAKSFYERLGFKVVKEEDVPIGPYWMNDYVMRLTMENSN